MGGKRVRDGWKQRKKKRRGDCQIYLLILFFLSLDDKVHSIPWCFLARHCEWPVLLITLSELNVSLRGKHTHTAASVDKSVCVGVLKMSTWEGLPHLSSMHYVLYVCVAALHGCLEISQEPSRQQILRVGFIPTFYCGSPFSSPPWHSITMTSSWVPPVDCLNHKEEKDPSSFSFFPSPFALLFSSAVHSFNRA